MNHISTREIKDPKWIHGHITVVERYSAVFCGSAMRYSNTYLFSSRYVTKFDKNISNQP